MLICNNNEIILTFNDSWVVEWIICKHGWQRTHIKSRHEHVRSLFVRSHSLFTKRHPVSAFVLLLWRCIRISGGVDQTLCPFCSSLFALRVLKAALVFEEPQDLCLDCHWHVFPHKCHIGCERFSLSRFWRCTRIDVLSWTSGLPNSPRVSPTSPLKCPSGDIRAENRYLLNFSPHRFIWQKLKHDLWLLEGGMSMIFADLYAPFVTPFAFWICIVPSALRY